MTAPSQRGVPPPSNRLGPMRQRSALAIAWAVVGVALTAHGIPGIAHARSAQLWAERGANSAPLAQVPDFRTLAHELIPTVVSIQVEQKMRGNPMGMGAPRGLGGQDPLEFFHRFFGGEVPQEFHNRGLGSGFIIDASGLILTNYHVVEDAATIEATVASPDGSERKVTARVLGTAPDYDIALLQSNEALPGAATAYLGDSDATQIGDWVMAVGNPLGLSHSVSVGIISAKERRDISPSGRHGLYNFLQTDASINPGNSGGPLVNMRGEVIGINSAVTAAGGIGFAIPVNMVKAMLPDLKVKGRYARSWLGIKIQALSPELAQTYGLSRTSGALVAEVVPGGPAADAKIREGDVILNFDGRDLRQANDLPLFASSAGVGKTVPVRVWRNNKELGLRVTLAEYPSDNPARASTSPTEAGALGLVVSDITPMLQQHLGLETGHGVVIKEVAEQGAAARAGLRPGDVITNVNGDDVANMHTLAAQLGRVKSGGMLRIRVMRGGTGLFVALKKP